MVYTIGEVVLDIIFKTIDDLKVKPGGSMLNTAVSLGRLGVKVSHVSQMSTDRASGMLIQFLEENGVNTKFIIRNSFIKTNLALAYLNEKNNAEYSFYKDKLELQHEFEFPAIESLDIIHYGSFFSINENIHPQLHAFLDKITDKQIIKLYDPNFRIAHLPELVKLKPMIENNIKKANIVKGSDEDFANIYGLQSGDNVWKIMKEFGVKILFYTKGEKGSEIHTNNGKITQDAHKVEVISTIGAGDTYSAGIIYFLKSKIVAGITIDDISLEQWRDCIKIAHNFSEQTCMSLDNYLSKEYCNCI